jgi:hypothetical protein
MHPVPQVLAKFPVVQHLVFGTLFPCTWTPSAPPSTPGPPPTRTGGAWAGVVAAPAGVRTHVLLVIGIMCHPHADTPAASCLDAVRAAAVVLLCWWLPHVGVGPWTHRGDAPCARARVALFTLYSTAHRVLPTVYLYYPPCTTHRPPLAPPRVPLTSPLQS